MITALLGADSFSKQRHIAGMFDPARYEVVTITTADQLPPLATLAEPTLFGPKRAFVLEGVFKSLDVAELVELGAADVVMVEESLDRRKSDVQKFLKHPNVKVVEFPAPTSADANAWLIAHAQSLDFELSKPVAQRLAVLLIGEATNSKIPRTLDVRRAHSEFEKIKAYAAGEQVTTEMVEALVPHTATIDVWAVLDALGNRKTAVALQSLETFYAMPDADEKTKTIQLTALLADQFRNILLTQDAQNRGVPDQQLLEQTGWKSGRLFIMKKLAKSFTSKQLRDTLEKLENLDMESKSSTLPSQVVIDLIVAQL